MIKKIRSMVIIPCVIAGVLASGVYAQTSVTDLYEVGQGNVALTTHSTQISNQYVYSPYGVQRNLNHPRQLKAGSSYQQLANRVRVPLDIKHNQVGYTGQRLDPSTDLMMLGGFRNYAPDIGRFIQPDTYNSFSKVAIDNDFAYVGNNPLSQTDPSGHFGVEDALSDVFSVAGVLGGFAGEEISGGMALAVAGFGFDGFSGGANILSSALGGSLGQGLSYFSDASGVASSLLGMGEARMAMLRSAPVAGGIGLSLDLLGIGSTTLSIAGNATHNSILSQVGGDLSDVAMGAGLLADGMASRIAAERMRNGLNAGSDALAELAEVGCQSYLSDINAKMNRTINAAEPVGRFSIGEAQKQAFAQIVGESMDLHMMLHSQFGDSVMAAHDAFLGQMDTVFSEGQSEIEGIEADREHYVVNQAFIGAQQIDHPNIHLDGMHGMSLFSNGLRDDLTPWNYFRIHAIAGFDADPGDYHMLLREAVERNHPNFWSRYAVAGRRNNGLE